MDRAYDSKNTFTAFFVIILCLFVANVIASYAPAKAFLIVGAALGIVLAFFYSHLALVVLIFAMLLSPEIVLGKLPKQDIIIRIEDILLATFCLGWIARMALDKNLRLIAKTPLNKFIGFYAAIFIFSTIRGVITSGVNPLKGIFFIVKYFEYFVIYFLVANTIKNKQQIERYLKAFLVTFAIVNVYAISQMGAAQRVSAPFEGTPGEPNTLGGYQVLMLAVVLGIFFHTSSLKLKFLLGSLVALTIVPFVNTLSRASYMAIIPMYFTFIIFCKSRRLILSGILIAAAVLSVFFLPDKVAERIKYTFIPYPQEAINPVKIFDVELGPSASARVHSWRRVVNLWKQSPYFGFGVTGLGFLDSQYIRTLAELGIIGFSAFLFLLVSIFRKTARVYRYTEDNILKGLAVGFLAGHVGMMFHALTANTYIIIRIMEPYWFLAAMVMVIPKITETRSFGAETASSKKHCPKNVELLLGFNKSA